MNRHTAIGNWNQLKGKIQAEWGDLTDQDFEQVEGDFGRLVGVIQEKTGEAREAIETRLAGLLQGSSEDGHPEGFGLAPEDLMEAAHDYAHQASEAVQQTAEQAAEALREKYRDAEQAVRNKPMESVAMSFAAGLVLGVGATLVMRSR